MMPDIFINSGLWGYIIVFMAINALVLLVVQLFTRKAVFLALSTIVAFIPCVVGYLGTYIGRKQTELVAASTNEIDIINESLMIANTPIKFGLWVSIPLIVLLLINSAIYIIARD